MASELSAFSEILRELLTKTLRIERRFDEGFEALMGRVLSQHTEVLVKLDKVEERFVLLSQELLLREREEPAYQAPFTAPVLSEQFVPRSEEYQRLMALLFGHGEEREGVIVLQGGAALVRRRWRRRCVMMSV